MIYTVVSIEFSIFVTKMYYSLIRRTVAIKVVMSTKIQNILYFISFCIEQYKNEKGLTGEQAMQQLEHYGVLTYLNEHYDVLHTQSAQWLLSDINEFIQIRKSEGI